MVKDTKDEKSDDTDEAYPFPGTLSGQVNLFKESQFLTEGKYEFVGEGKLQIIFDDFDEDEYTFEYMGSIFNGTKDRLLHKWVNVKNKT